MTKVLRPFIYIVTTTLLVLGYIFIPISVKAESVAELEARISELLAEVNAIRTQISQLKAVSSIPSYTFTRNLRVGDKGEEVRKLQMALNSDGETRVALSGAGSIGHETDYFGLLTKGAVTRFQEKHRTEVLSPLNLSSGTGFFGPSTRAKINMLFSQQVGAPTNTQIPSYEPISGNGEVIVAFLTKHYGMAGENIAVVGSGFSSNNNTVIFGNHIIENLPSTATFFGDQIGFIVPNGVSKGEYEVNVKVGGKLGEATTFSVTDDTSLEPLITSISPASGSAGTTVTLVGSGFSLAQNKIYTGYDVLLVPSSDGKTLSFIVSAGPLENAPPELIQSLSPITLNFLVENEGGLSNAVIFKLVLE